MSDAATKIKVFGTLWCGDSRRAKRFLDENHVEYDWIDIDTDKAGAEYVMSVNHGNRSVPTILFADGSILVEPSTFQLSEKIKILNVGT
jgi:glutaredoxin-like protein